MSFPRLDFHHQAGFQLPGDPVVDDGKLPDPLILNMGTVGDPE
jgi:hypothetical protein